ncbi:hypothetical protein RDV64_02455 [Acuticoccus sp. MNP-M23]|uniref:hypothetical protein n=1 Tax=Acuticoccus sp. MNP-M23 TaxID=3072793 RepID=UPI002815E4ED|nr:hypothetical protein [Acuticoccus sp. MNP-M23]WMS43285.1 hypothetical protein RDV64_02455 [Acuticoccus sp. MNP-M23]
MSAPGTKATRDVVDVDCTITRIAVDGTLCELQLDWPDAFKGVGAGQFALLASLAPGAPILPRPLSLVPRMDGALAIAFNIKAAGTQMLAAAQPGDRIALIGPLGNRFSAPAEPITIVVDAYHAGTMLALCHERRAAGYNDRVLMVEDGPNPSDGPILAAFKATGAAVDYVPLASLSNALTRAAPAFIAAGAGNSAMSVSQAYAARAEIPGEASLQAAMACGLGVCKVCIHGTRGGPPLLVCEGPIFPLSQPDFGEAA